MRLGIYGGSFDPIHNAHLALARACQRHGKLDQVWFVPTAVQPLKQQGPRASDDDRVEMVRLAIESEPSWRVSTLEIDRGGMSYTVETLRQIDEQLPAAKLFFLIGGDTLRDMPHWREPEIIFHLATPLVVRRAGEPELDLSALRKICAVDCQPREVEFPMFDISSSTIRARVASGKSIDDLVPAPVGDYIARRGLYREKTP